MKYSIIFSIVGLFLINTCQGQSFSNQTPRPERITPVPEQNLGTRPTSPTRPIDPQGQRPDSFDKSCEDRLKEITQLARNQKERIDLLEYIKKDLEKENFALKEKVGILESQVATLKAQLAAKGK